MEAKNSPGEHILRHMQRVDNLSLERPTSFYQQVFLCPTERPPQSELDPGPSFNQPGTLLLQKHGANMPKCCTYDNH